MKRSLQEIIELVIFGLIALLVATGLLWLGGWLLGGVGVVFKFIAGLLWALLRFVLPIAIVAGVIFFLVRLLAKPRNKPVTAAATVDSGSATLEGVANTASDKMSDAASAAGDKVAEVASTVSDKTSEVMGAAADKASELADTVTTKAVEVKDSITGDSQTAAEKLEANRAKDQANEPETRVDDAEPVDVTVDTSGFKEMDDVAEDLEDADDTKS